MNAMESAVAVSAMALVSAGAVVATTAFLMSNPPIFTTQNDRHPHQPAIRHPLRDSRVAHPQKNVKLPEQIARERNAHNEAYDAIERLVAPLGDRLPEVFAAMSPGTPGSGAVANMMFSVGYMPSDGRDLFLSMVGEAFGTDGWERHESYSRGKFDWRKQIGGVLITLNEAESAPKIVVPVPPSAFPIALPSSES